MPRAKISFTNNAAVPADNAMRVYTGTTTTIFDNDNTMAGTALLTIKTAGVYHVIVEAWTATLGNQIVYALKNTTTIIAAGNVIPGNAGDQNRPEVHAACHEALAVNDTIKVGYSNAGGPGIGGVNFRISATRHSDSTP